VSRTWRPVELAEALRIRAGERAVPCAGGTDLMGQELPADTDRPVLFLDRIAELARIASTRGFIEIGAGATLAAIGASPVVPPTLREVVREMAGPAIRNVATIGGNIANGSPAADTLPLLYAFDSYVRLASRGGDRTVPIQEFIRGPGATALAADEILVGVLVPRWEPQSCFWRKVGARKANAIAKVSLAAFAEWSGGASARPGGSVIARARLALGAVAPTVIRVRDAERMLEGTTRGELAPMLAGLLACVRAAVRPIDDQRSTAAYRRRVAEGLTKAFVTDVLGRQA
jgi:xanthine dehydrogenase FAD-binding subunit